METITPSTHHVSIKPYGALYPNYARIAIESDDHGSAAPVLEMAPLDKAFDRAAILSVERGKLAIVDYRKGWIIRLCNGAEYWSNLTGWGSRAGADVFTQSERDRLNLPMEGEWIQP
jgi:hypothetical protein